MSKLGPKGQMITMICLLAGMSIVGLINLGWLKFGDDLTSYTAVSPIATSPDVIYGNWGGIGDNEHDCRTIFWHFEAKGWGVYVETPMTVPRVFAPTLELSPTSYRAYGNTIFATTFGKADQKNSLMAWRVIDNNHVIFQDIMMSDGTEYDMNRDPAPDPLTVKVKDRSSGKVIPRCGPETDQAVNQLPRLKQQVAANAAAATARARDLINSSAADRLAFDIHWFARMETKCNYLSGSDHTLAESSPVMIKKTYSDDILFGIIALATRQVEIDSCENRNVRANFQRVLSLIKSVTGKQ